MGYSIQEVWVRRPPWPRHLHLRVCAFRSVPHLLCLWPFRLTLIIPPPPPWSKRKKQGKVEAGQYQDVEQSVRRKNCPWNGKMAEVCACLPLCGPCIVIHFSPAPFPGGNWPLCAAFNLKLAAIVYCLSYQTQWISFSFCSRYPVILVC